MEQPLELTLIGFVMKILHLLCKNETKVSILFSMPEDNLQRTSIYQFPSMFKTFLCEKFVLKPEIQEQKVNLFCCPIYFQIWSQQHVKYNDMQKQNKKPLVLHLNSCDI